MPATPELLAPGGSLSQAVHALRAGADAVYCGSPRFSARSHARNLDFPELRRLCGEAQARQSRVYLALNTLLADDELPAALETAWLACEAGVSALIIQDLGLLRALRLHGPDIPLHASTQMAIHNAGGARQVEEWGISRAVLARELSLDEIAAIRAAVPGLELEVFIHGALCYGVSGLCLASGLLLGRSGNRGDCGQICRTWSRLDKALPGVPQAGHWFSMNDLELSEAVRGLAGIGVHSLKIEGRMKPPEWTAAVVRHYRAVLDGKDPADTPGLEAARVVFGRRPSPGYLAQARGQDLINPVQAGGTGIPAGVIEQVEAGRIRLKALCRLAVKDGVQILRPGRSGEPPQVVRAAIRGIEILDRNGSRRPAFDCLPGQTLWLGTDRDSPFLPADRGKELAKVADHASNLPGIRPESLPLHHRGLAVTAGWRPGLLELRCPSRGLSLDFPVDASPAHGPGTGLADQLRDQLEQPGDSAFGLARLDCDGSLDSWFVPPSRLKQLRREWYALLDADAAARRLAALAAFAAAAAASPALAGPGVPHDPPPRSSLSPRGGLPFVTGFASLQAGDLPVWQGWKVLPLAPVWFDGDRARADFLDWIGRQASGGPWLIGINNPAQLDWVRAARESGGGGPDVSPACSIAWFADYALYAANRQAQTLLAESLPGLLWAGPWIEQPGTAADPDFRPPLFISRACFRHQSLGQACPGGGPEACARRFDYRLEQGKQSFNVVVRDCLSYTFLAT